MYLGENKLIKIDRKKTEKAYRNLPVLEDPYKNN
jgi:hypothetical protein